MDITDLEYTHIWISNHWVNNTPSFIGNPTLVVMLDEVLLIVVLTFSGNKSVHCPQQ